MTDHGPVEGHAAHEQHGGVAKYIYVFLALCLLTGASFFTYSRYWPLGHHEAWAFMMAVSCTKAMLVILFFMHLKYEADWKYVLTIPASLMSLFLVLMLVPDIGMRVKGFFGYGYSETRLENVGTVAEQEALIAASRAAAAHHGEESGHEQRSGGGHDH